jgi:hypothetical protein
MIQEDSYYKGIVCHICAQSVCPVCGSCCNRSCENCSCPLVEK